MAILVKTVDKSSVNFTDTFTYTINASFSGLVGNIDSARITDFIPSYISYTLPPVALPLKGIEETPVVGGTLITFDFGSITNLGISIAINLKCKFKLGTDSQTEFINQSNLYINNELNLTSSSDPVLLDVSEDFIVEKDIAIPTNKQSAPGGRVIYTIILRNKLKSEGGNGDLGAKVNDIVITDVLPEELILDSNFEVYGYDISNKTYADTRYDGTTGTVVGNTITFNLPDYYGTKYRIVFICNVDQDVEIGSSIVNSANLAISSQDRGTASVTLDIGEADYGAYINKYGPNYGSVGNYISFELSVGNNANQDLFTFTIEDIIPDEVEIYRINTGSFKIDMIDVLVKEEYTIEYEINKSGQYNLLGRYNTDTAVYVNMPTLQPNQKITKIRWNIANFSVGIVQNQKIVLDGVIMSTNSSGQFTNIGRITWNEPSGTSVIQDTNTTILNDKSELNIKKVIKDNVVDLKPMDIFTYKIIFTGEGSQVNNPIVSDLLSEKVSYIGNERYVWYDYFDDITMTSSSPNFYDLVPIEKQIIENFNNTGKVLVRYNLNGFSLSQKGIFTIEFDVAVKPGSTGVILNNAVLGNQGNNGIPGPLQIVYPDSDDRDGDGITNENLVITPNVSTNIIFSASLASDKKVKGALDSEYTEEPNVGLTYSGGNVDYKLVITNTGNLNFEYLQIVDILPHIDDTGVILNTSSRGSEFDVYNGNIITAAIVENNIVIDKANILVEYSKSYDPVRFSSQNFGNSTIGVVDDWSNTPPNPITDAKSIKITLINKILYPNQSLEIDIKCIASMRATPNLVAWNSFAVKASYRNENNTVNQLIPVEPEKVGVRVLALNKASIGGKVWLDKNENGNIDPGELGINGITVELLSSKDIVLDKTVTTNDSKNSPGYYVFNNLDIGDYYVQFIKPDNLYFTLCTSYTQNKADTNTGKTEMISIMNQTQAVTNIDAGFIENINYIFMLLDVLNDDIYSAPSDSLKDMINTINNANKTLIEISNSLIGFWSKEIANKEINNAAYKSQLQRLIYIVQNIVAELESLKIPSDYCNANLVANIMDTSIQYTLDLMRVVENDDGLNAYYDKCSCTGAEFYNILMGKFINSITRLDGVSYTLNDILRALYADLNYTNRPYVAAYVPNPKINTPPYKQMNICCPPDPNFNRNFRNGCAFR